MSARAHKRPRLKPRPPFLRLVESDSQTLIRRYDAYELDGTELNLQPDPDGDCVTRGECPYPLAESPQVRLLVSDTATDVDVLRLLRKIGAFIVSTSDCATCTTELPPMDEEIPF
jgi:hypothetical protein